jgi:hypothetical protein
VIATIRTMLNYFLAKDIAEFDRARQSGGNPPSGAGWVLIDWTPAG